MEIKFNLQKLLKDYGLFRGSVIYTQIEAATGISRRTISDICQNNKRSISLDHLSKICTWLHSKGVPSEKLPSGLFSTGRANLWQALAKGGIVTIYLGEYYQKKGTPAGRYVSRRDSEVAAAIVKRLSMGGTKGSTPQDSAVSQPSINSKNGPLLQNSPILQPPPPQMRLQYVPFCYILESFDMFGRGIFQRDVDITKEIYENMKVESAGNTSILIGSQRTNYLLEHFVAELFGCEPFSHTTEQKSAHVPIFTVYRKDDRKIRSCFGGVENPFTNQKNASIPGIHYLDKGNKWAHIKWEEYDIDSGKTIKDAGMIITMKNNRTRAIQIAIFGFSGRSTGAIADQFVIRKDEFWPPYVEVRGREVGIYVCKFKLLEPKDKIIEGTIETTDCKPIRLSEGILKKYLC